VPGENDHFSNGSGYLKAIVSANEILGLDLPGQISRNVDRIDAFFGEADGIPIDVCCDYRDVRMQLQPLQDLVARYGEGIRFFSS